MANNQSERLLLAEIRQRRDLKEFTKAAMQALCSSSEVQRATSEMSPEGAALLVAQAAVRIARVTLAELERNQ